MMLRISLGIMVWQTVVQLLMPSILVNGQCEYRQYMDIGRAYYVYNNEYPYYYQRGTSCKWIATSPSNSKIYLSCEEVNVPPSQNCYLERLSVSLSGNEQLTDGQNYCGNGTLSLVSNSNAMTIGLFADYYAKGGRIMCTITAIASAPPTTERPSNCDCGQRYEKRIVGGVETGINEFPFMAAIYNHKTKAIQCGATIISKRYSLTAAHCIQLSIFLTDMLLLVGDHDYSTGSDTASADAYIFESAYKHENYDSTSTKMINDIALLRVNRDILFSDRVGQACLPFRLTGDLAQATVTLVGWGSLEFTGVLPTALRKVDVEVESVNKCRGNLTDQVIVDSQICTFAPGKDACQFDSGGPVLYENRDIRRMFITGIISYGKACAANSFAVNTRVSSYLQWIIQHTGDTNYCIR